MPRVEELGRALGIADHAIRVFAEGDIRGPPDLSAFPAGGPGTAGGADSLKLPPWEAIVPGERAGTLVQAADLTEVEGRSGPLLLLLKQADGEAEIPAAVKGIALGHPMPHLSHLGVRARQARIPFAAGSTGEQLEEFAALVGKTVRLRHAGGAVAPGDKRHFTRRTRRTRRKKANKRARPQVVPATIPTKLPVVLRLDQAKTETCGAKDSAAWRLLELAGSSGGLFQRPRGWRFLSE